MIFKWLFEGVTNLASRFKFDDFKAGLIFRKSTYPIGHRRFAKKRIRQRKRGFGPEWSFVTASFEKRKKKQIFKPQKKQAKRIARKVVHGEHYNLQEIYDRVNTHYFEGLIDVQITWFGSQKRAARRRRVLGLYDFNNKLIKIHRLLDHPNFPSYFISYVVYHEMLHHVFPPTQKRRGRRKIHHADFKLHEKKFAEYSLAKEWEKENHQIFFSKKGSHGEK